eukprot:SAG31_NODE_20330_length_577_cov_1.361925_1_plen_72_part_10
MGSIFDAARSGDLAAVKLYASGQANLEETDAHSRTALHLAAWAGKDEVVDFLIERGAAVDAKAMDGVTPLSF